MDLKLIMIIMAILVIVTVGIVVLIVMKTRNNYVAVSNTEDKPKKVKSIKKKIIDEEETGEEVNENGLVNYNCYKMNNTEKVKWVAVGMAIVFVAGYIFYQSIICSLVFSLIGLIFPKIMKKEIISKRKQKLLLQFKEALYVISTSLSAGKAVENAFLDAKTDLESVFDYGKENYIIDELTYINRRIKMNQTIEEALEDFAERSGLDDIKTFANVFIACKSTGGNLKSVTEMTSRIIGEKISVKQDIQTLISGKKFEANILGLIPFGIILFIQASSPDFLISLYTIQGRIMATGALLVIGVSVLWGRKIMSIEV